jgi:adenylate cyclase
VLAYRFGEFELRPDERLLVRSGEPLIVGARALDLLTYLVDHRDRVVPKAELLEQVWPGIAVEEANLTVQISALRKSLGARALSTVPGRGYRFVMPVAERQADVPGAASTHAAPLDSARPTLAVMPFVNLSGDPEHELFADGLLEDLITTLSKVSGLTVIARASTFTYKGRPLDVRQVGRELDVRHVMAGSVRINDGRLRVAAQLIAARTGAQIWAERYDRMLDDVFTLQDELSLILVTELQVQLTEGEQARLRRASIRNMEAWSHWVRGLACYNRAVLSRAGMTPALMSWQQASARDPGSATLQGMLGMLYYLDARFGFWNDREVATRKCGEHIEAALSRDPECVDAHTVLGLLRLLQCRHGDAVAAARLSLSFGPSSADAAAFAAFVFANAGLGPEAVVQIERAMRLCPMFPPFYMGHLGLAYRTAGRIRDSIAAFEKYERLNAGRGATDLVILHGQLGEKDKARAWADRLLSVFPEFNLRAWRETQFRADADGIRQDMAVLRAFGLCE